ncbi:cupin domain-containing protein [Flavihumibacter sp. CACIAM 22H1]|uniref:cupin domain-containing protein n=1 Tax=Flavihumibacter sp. CACIAM 22H1 TaxID=1812911 RepID=UPI0007A86A3E|nr:cupin domain-containing protein [Flavihumibacter sp. CACIAM 22H1]KYP13587.1 MAG: cupin [Flavihumibacter sp. CACIAM 22H1]
MQHLNDLPAKEIQPGQTGKFIHGEKSSLGIWDIKKGVILPLHQHENEQITYILEGELEMTINGKTTVFKAGNLELIPANTPHSAVALTDCKVLDSWTPVREAFL